MNRLLPLIVAACLSAGACADQVPSASDGAERLLAAALPQNAKIESVSASGVGCPEGTWEANISEDHHSFQVMFREFELAADERKLTDSASCKVLVKVGGEDGTSYAPVTVGVESEVDVESGAQATLGTNVRWIGGESASRASTRINGPENARVASGGISERLWSACSGSRELSVDVTASVKTRKGRRDVAEARVDVENLGKLSFASRTCEPTPKPTEPDAGTAQSAEATIGGVRTTGAGCPDGTAVATIAPDRKSFTVDFNDFSLVLDENARSERKLCSLVVDVKAPAGQTVALEAFKATGKAELSPGMEATMTRSVSFTGLGNFGGEKTTNLIGPVSSEFEIDDTFAGKDLGFAPCDVARSLFIDLGFSIRNSNPPAKGSLKLSNVKGVRFALRSCGG